MAKAAIIIGMTPKEDSRPAGVRIKMPEGFEWPEGVDPEKGEKIIVTAVPDGDGYLILKDFDGIPLTSGEADEEDDAPASTSPMDAGEMFTSALKSYGK